jgi:hypothetical protein
MAGKGSKSTYALRECPAETKRFCQSPHEPGSMPLREDGSLLPTGR